MKTRTRFIKSVIKAAKEDVPPLPWTRGKCRADFVSRRSETRDVPLRKTA